MGLKDKNNEWQGEDPIWKFASINAITYLAAGIFGKSSQTYGPNGH